LDYENLVDDEVLLLGKLERRGRCGQERTLNRLDIPQVRKPRDTRVGILDRQVRSAFGIKVAARITRTNHRTRPRG
jgi:hypothetical protein